MKRSLSVLVAAAALAAPLGANAGSTGARDGIVRFPAASAQPATIDCAPFYVCDVMLERGETVLNVAIGDSVRWIIAPAASGTASSTPHILIKPTEANLRTNLVIMTDRRSYDLVLHSVQAHPMLRVGFVYPPDPPQATPAPSPSPSPSPEPTATPSAPALDFRYTTSGDKHLVPAHVFNDGTHTVLQFSAQLPVIPVLLAIGPNGDQLINYRVRDGVTYIIDGVPDRLALLVGSGKGQQRATIARSL